MLSKPSKVLTRSRLWLRGTLFTFIVLVSGMSNANTSPELTMFDSSGAMAAPGVILKSDATMTLTGLINHVVVIQHYRNENPFAVNARYVFPLADESAVHAMTMRIGERVIKGEIDKKAVAESRYQEAKQAGQQAALVRQQRANMFVSNVANIGPGEEVQIQLQYQEVIDYRSGTFALRFPTTITPRYHPINVVLQAQEQSDHPSSNEQPSFTPSAWIAPIYSTSRHGDAPQSEFSLTINIDVGLELVDIQSKYHKVAIENPAFGRYRVALNESNAMNRDFLLEFKPLQKEQAQAAFFTEQLDNGERYGLLMLLPPDDHFTQTQRLARELIFVVDTSGSMHGQSMEQAKSALYYALSLLDSNDSFNIIGFDDQVMPMSTQPVPANDFNLRRAERFVYDLQADGGTDIKGALDSVLDGQAHTGYVRQVVFLTDGSVSNEDALFKHISAELGDSRLFTVGIGSAPNSYFMRRAADVGRGTFTHIGSTAQVQPKMQQLFDKLAHPAITQLALINDGIDQQLEYWPSPLPDLYFSEPVMVAVKLDSQAAITLTGQTAQGPLAIKLSTQQGQSAQGVARLWARQKIKSLLLYNQQQQVKAQVESLALEHQLLSPFTAFIAIEQTPLSTVAEHNVQVANQLPQGLTMRLPQTDGQSRLSIVLGLLLLSGVAVLRFKK
ncbi:marine proteobacterial sortase target protein [Pseudoalteromonas sp. S1727]|uniref:marine proteobacterial sortase target protein n=1 Tax=Pseudoalteromonas sp. S1727 TaxID=2066514 RepID=UPI0011098737|nr:marine proteobacterial sortase target protein [Pseudoalteromonas sp. S1727]TMN70980.1 marine proteobacterial sortase target protein [Pseudoalteromonas sp. S1727]